MKHFNLNYWCKLWLLCAPIFSEKSEGNNIMSTNSSKIKKWSSNSNTDTVLLTTQKSNFNNYQNYSNIQPWNNTWNNNLTSIQLSTALELSHKLKNKTYKKRIKRTYNDDRNEIEHSIHILGGYTAYCSFKPEFWEEIVQLKINNNKNEFQDKFIKKVLNKIWINWRIEHSYNIRLIGGTIYDNFWTIADTFINSSRRQRIRILTDSKQNGWLIKTTYVSSNIRTDETQKQNLYLDNLETSFPIWNSSETYNLGIINNNDFRNAIKQKYPNCITEEISIVNTEKFSHLCKCFKFQLYAYNTKNYSFGNLRPFFSYITQIKINELNSIIENDRKVKQWRQQINDWNSTLPQAITNAKNFSLPQLYNWKRQEKEIIKGYLRDWNYIQMLIEDEWKLDELTKNVEGIKENFETLKNQINDLKQKITNLNNVPNWTCTNIATITGGIIAPTPIIGDIASSIAYITSGLCDVAKI